MDILKNFESLPWCEPDWSVLDVDKETNVLLKQCNDLPKMEISDDVQEIIRKSKEFPISFPINTIRLEKLKEVRPIARLNMNTASTYPVIHEKVLLLMTRFLNFKREFGSPIEKPFYKDMSVPDLIDRILKKRAVTFMGPRDTYKLLSGENGKDGWESVGTLQQTPPLLLENCLSYDEIKLSSFVYVSGYTECINDGSRHNKGIAKQENIEDHAVIIGVIGPRFKRKHRMEYEDVVITEQQNTLSNGFGEEVRNDPDAKCMWRKMWAEFYQVPSFTYTELKSKVRVEDKPEETRYTDRYVKIPRSKNIFDNEVYYKRICVTAECALLDAEARAAAAGKSAFLHLVGAGLGVWRATPHQNDVFVLTFLERVQSLLLKDLLNHVSDIILAYIQPSSNISELFKSTSSSGDEQVKQIFFKSKTHSKGGINVQLENRNPSSKLTGEREGKLLVMTYAWDGNAHPGNEFWYGRMGDNLCPPHWMHPTDMAGPFPLELCALFTHVDYACFGPQCCGLGRIGKLDTSGDPAAACSTQVSELHNAHINSAVSACNTRVAGRIGLASLQHYSSSLAT